MRKNKKVLTKYFISFQKKSMATIKVDVIKPPGVEISEEEEEIEAVQQAKQKHSAFG
jgi:hypothetical protein